MNQDKGLWSSVTNSPRQQLPLMPTYLRMNPLLISSLVSDSVTMATKIALVGEMMDRAWIKWILKIRNILCIFYQDGDSFMIRIISLKSRSSWIHLFTSITLYDGIEKIMICILRLKSWTILICFNWVSMICQKQSFEIGIIPALIRNN